MTTAASPRSVFINVLAWAVMLISGAASVMSALALLMTLTWDHRSPAADVPGFLLIVVCPPLSFAAGLGLRRRRRWAYDYIVALLFTPVPANTPTNQPGQHSNIGLFLAIAGVGSGFAAAIGAGSRLSGDTAPAEITAIFYPSVIVFLAVLLLTAWRIARHVRRARAAAAGPLRQQIDDHFTS